MKEHYDITINGVKRSLPLCPLTDKLKIAAFVIFGDVELTKAAAQGLLDKIDFEYDYLITAESKGIPLIYEMARISNQNKYFLARKAPKLYMRNILKCEVKSITTTKQQTLYLDGYDADLMRGKRIIIVDDVISTGESLHAMEQLVEQAGGIIAGRMAILAEGDAYDRDDIITLEYLPLFDENGEPLPR